jgi:glutamate synthase domain-containing protein 2/glutamate synthase domain-containing protein 1/glutamate synthase domain-containing protein 3
MGFLPAQGLYDPRLEHDACGLGFVVDIPGRKSHQLIRDGLQILKNLAHRGACGCDPETGDGAGVLIQRPDALFRARVDFDLPAEYGVAMVFLPQESHEQLMCEGMLERVAESEGLTVLGWRDVPVNPAVLGRLARASQPKIRQLFVTAPLAGDALERKLYVVRKQAEKALGGYRHFYIPSFSTRTVIYKGLLLAPQIEHFYLDLADPLAQSAICLVHQRFSTNTFPSWPLAHPYRYLCHNGEINTVRGNIAWMNAREPVLRSAAFGGDLPKCFPVVTPGGSDSASLDNVVELMALAGRSLAHTMAILIPEAWDGDPAMPPAKKAFYEFHASLMEPWDGPAAIAFTDGAVVGATLDRNGLRPARYVVTRSGQIVLASETGVLELDPADIQAQGRLQPGRMLLVDTRQQRIVPDEEIKEELAARRPYAEWMKKGQRTLAQLPEPPFEHPVDHATLLRRQRAFGYSEEDLRLLLGAMAQHGEEPVGSMGVDIPLACLSDRPQLLFHYFKQMFAQVTNPAIDPIREELVMSLASYIGEERNLLDESVEHCQTLKLPHPLLTNRDLEKLRHASLRDLRTITLPAVFPAAGGGAALEQAIAALSAKASQAARDGYRLIVLSDRTLDAVNAPIPSLLALSAVHHHLVREGSRTRVALIVESGEPREVMHFALLIGYGASAVNPYLAIETLNDLCRNGLLDCGASPDQAVQRFFKAVNKGLLKVFSKMGISTLQSYRGAQVFEAVGLARDLVDRYFAGTLSRIGGVGLEVLAEVARRKHAHSLEPLTDSALELDPGGRYAWRAHGERHLLNPATVSKLQHAVRQQKFETFREFSALVDEQSRALCTLRGLMEFRFDPAGGVPLAEVEPASEIVKRFATGAMSFGSISKEAHETLAVAMNRIGGRSNTGEGGEDPARFAREPNGDWKRSAVKQVASGRFGVTAHYLVNADELQIKIAQGAKPGEGGQLPGHKVDEIIARVRHSIPGVPLISPPPHHDIYSIEDLAQLIFDLKNVNPQARISVKLVSESGVGTVAAGVAKAHADVILISGHDGGTGASPLTSIHHAGTPWELGLAETQQTLVLNDLRSRVRLQTDGKLQTGRDVAIAALLGAEEFGFSTAPLVAMGCIMMRKCHLNTCPVGIATQDPVLRARFAGAPEHVINYFFFVAEELRAILARLGFRTLEEAVGRVDKLEMRAAVDHWKAKGLDYSALLYDPPVPRRVGRRNTSVQSHGLAEAIDHTLIGMSLEALEDRTPVRLRFPIRNVHRSVGAMLSGEVARRYGAAGLPGDTIHIAFRGSAGQSFGAFLAHGITLQLEGDANDYVGKGLSGGRIVVYPPRESSFQPEENIIVGNVVLYGATSGEAFFNGMAGERFAVRNSGATAVVEGVGDHGCEYMTNGLVVVLGRTGRNFAAGMTGGVAFVLDESGEFAAKLCNRAGVDLDPAAEDGGRLRELIERHAALTGSPRARWILDDWPAMLPRFVKVFPHEYKRVLGVPRSRAAEVGRG